MEQAVAYSTLAVTVTLALARPRIAKLRFTPGLAALTGVLLLFAARLLTVDDLLSALRIQWRPLLSLSCIMVMTGVVDEVGAFERLAALLEAHARRTSAARTFAIVFAASVVTPSLLNNDSAILLLTPLTVALTRRLYPGRPQVTEAFAFAVFLAPGVAPFVVSNPMNMIVAEYAGISFNGYAAVMAPISLCGAALTWLILRRHFGPTLLVSAEARAVVIPRRHPSERAVLLLLGAVFLAYPLTALLGGRIWMVTLAGALLCLLLGRGAAPLPKLLGHVSFDILLFLWGVFLVVGGLRHVGVTARLASFYHLVPGGSALQIAVVGTTSALGSALVDNHPMSILNMLALGGNSRTLLAALVGGDIGPRLLPMGSLAGLLWMDLLRRSGVPIGLGRFVRLGTLVLVPTLALSLILLSLLT